MNNILVLTNSLDDYGGISRSCNDFIQSIKKNDSNIKIDVIEKKILFNRKLKSTFFLNRKLIFILKTICYLMIKKYKIIYVSHISFSFVILFIILFNLKTELFIHVHGIEIWGKLKFYEKIALKKSKFILAVSSYTKEFIIKKYRLDESNIFILNNKFNDIYRFYNPSKLKLKYKIPLDKTIITTVSRIDKNEKYKNHEFMIYLINKILNYNKNILYFIIGDGSDKPRLKNIIDDLKLNKNIKLLGKISDSDLKDFYNMADINILPSHCEGFGITYIESMACGTLSIGLNEKGAPDALTKFNLGYAINFKELDKFLLKFILNKSYLINKKKLAKRTEYYYGSEAYDKNVQKIFLSI